MKVLFISNDPDIFDKNSSVRERMRKYAESIGELHIVSRGEDTIDENDGKLFLHSVESFPTPVGRMLTLGMITRKAKEIISKYNIELVSSQDPFEHGRVAVRAVRDTEVKLHIQVHTDFCSPFFAKESYKNSIRVHMADVVLLRADGIRTVSNRVSQSLIKRYGSSIVEPVVIPIVPDIDSYFENNTVTKNVLPKTPFSFVITTVGRLEKEKRFEDSIRVVASLKNKHYPVGLVIVGNGSMKKKLITLVEELDIKDRVVFLGARTDVSDILHSSNAFIQTSSYEGYGRTYIEAALAKVPMVVTSAGVIGDIFTHDVSVLVCDVGDIKCLSIQMSRLIESTALRYSLSKKAFEIASAHISEFGDIPSLVAADFAQVISLTNVRHT